MKRFLYARLAADNIRKNARLYIPYIIACIVLIIMFYSFLSLSGHSELESSVVFTDQTQDQWSIFLPKKDMGRFIMHVLEFCVIIIGVFSGVFLFYTYGSLIKKRKKEFALLNVLGMEKKHIVRVIGWETVYTTVISLVLGLGLGLLFDKLMYMLLLRFMDIELTVEFYIAFEPILKTVLLFLFFFAIIFVLNVERITLANPMSLLSESKAGDKEPKLRIVSAIFGILCLAGSYLISTSELFAGSSTWLWFVIWKWIMAALLGVFGTYLFFCTVTVAILKLLKKNKKYYYKTKHFISVSNLMYRMRRNAFGLANICLMSTIIIGILSITLSAELGIEKTIDIIYPHDEVLTIDTTSENYENLINEAVDAAANECGVTVYDKTSFHYIDFSHYQTLFGNYDYLKEVENIYETVTDYYNGQYREYQMRTYAFFFPKIKEGVVENGYDIYGNINYTKQKNYNSTYKIYFISLSEYNHLLGKNAKLNNNEIILLSDDPIICENKECMIQKSTEFKENGDVKNNPLKTYKIVDTSTTLPDVLKTGLNIEVGTNNHPGTSDTINVTVHDQAFLVVSDEEYAYFSENEHYYDFGGFTDGEHEYYYNSNLNSLAYDENEETIPYEGDINDLEYKADINNLSYRLSEYVYAFNTRGKNNQKVKMLNLIQEKYSNPISWRFNLLFTEDEGYLHDENQNFIYVDEHGNRYYYNEDENKKGFSYNGLEFTDENGNLIKYQYIDKNGNLYACLLEDGSVCPVSRPISDGYLIDTDGNRVENNFCSIYSSASSSSLSKYIYEIFGSLLFICIFLSVLFILAMILIIYYKQISEAQEDRNSFEIMQKVGLTHKEIRKSIRSQVLTTFFLPLLLSALHMIFSVSLLATIARLAFFSAVDIFNIVLTCTLIGIAIFALIYTVVYFSTSHVYYKIVVDQKQK